MWNHIGNFLIVVGVLVMVGSMVWAGFRIMYLEREVETLGHVVDECLEVVP